MQVDKAVADKDRSIALCLVRHAIPAFLMPRWCLPSGKQKLHCWLLAAGWLLTAWCVLRAPLTFWWIDCAALYPCVKRACVTNRSMSLRAFFLAVGFIVDMIL
jgi:hypothetical protein